MKPEPEGDGPRLSERRFGELAAFLRSRCGIHLEPRKRLMVESRLMRRLRASGAGGFEAYCEQLFEHRDEVELSAVVDLLTTHKTDFFRERHHFEFLASRIAAPFRQLWPQGEKPLRVWSAGCSTGEEPYTIAMVLQEALQGGPFRVLATDVSEGTLQQAERGLYDEQAVEPIPAETRRRCLRSTPAGFEVDPALRQRVLFRYHNLMDDQFPDRPRHHVIFCRNTLVYFDRETQRRVLNKMTRALVPRGFLFLGHSESLTGTGLPFESLGPTTFRKRGES